EQRNFHCRGFTKFECACPPKRMNSGKTGIFAYHCEKPSSSARCRSGNFQDRPHLFFLMNKSMKNFPTIFGRCFSRIALVNILQIFAHKQYVEWFCRKFYSAYVA